METLQTGWLTELRAERKAAREARQIQRERELQEQRKLYEQELKIRESEAARFQAEAEARLIEIKRNVGWLSPVKNAWHWIQRAAVLVGILYVLSMFFGIDWPGKLIAFGFRKTTSVVASTWDRLKNSSGASEIQELKEELARLRNESEK